MCMCVCVKFFFTSHCRDHSADRAQYKEGEEVEEK